MAAPKLETIEIEDVSEAAPEIVDAETDLRACIADIMSGKGKAFILHREIAELVRAAISKAGFLARSRDGYWFYDRAAKQLRDTNSEDFHNYLARLTGLNLTEKVLEFVLKDLHVRTSGLEPIKIYSISHRDRETGQLWMSDGAGGMWVSEQDGSWEYRANGDGLMFYTKPDVKPWTPDFSAEGEALKWYLDQGSFETYQHMSADEQRLGFQTVLAYLLVNSGQVRPILIGIGATGSGKTTLLRSVGLLLEGESFKESAVPTSVKDIAVALSQNIVYLLDNLDSFMKGLEDLLCAYVTGADWKERKLYLNNSQCVMQLSALFMITSRTPRFNREDVATRVIPMHFIAPVEYKSEDKMHDDLLARRDQIMGDLLTLCRKVANKLDAVPSAAIPPSKSRIASFYEFGWAMHAEQDASGHWSSPVWERIFKGILVAQLMFLVADNNIMDTVNDVLTDHNGSIEAITPKQLFTECVQKTQGASGIGLPKTVNVFADRLYSLKTGLLELYRIRLERKDGHAGAIILSLKPVGRDDGEVVKAKEPKY